MTRCKSNDLFSVAKRLSSNSVGLGMLTLDFTAFGLLAFDLVAFGSTSFGFAIFEFF